MRIKKNKNENNRLNKKELLERVIGKFKSILYSSLVSYHAMHVVHVHQLCALKAVVAKTDSFDKFEGKLCQFKFYFSVSAAV